MVHIKSTQDFLDDFGVWLKTERLRLNITQKIMADNIGISLRAYQNMESKGHGLIRHLVRALIILRKDSHWESVFKSKETFSTLDEYREAGPVKRLRSSSVRRKR